MNRLKLMSMFVHIVECGSISAAAERLQLSKSVLSQHLSRLEAELGETLLLRTTRRQRLTDVGVAFFRQCQQMQLQADQAWAEAQQRQQMPSGLVRLTAPHALMEQVVAPAVGSLIQAYPQLCPELLASDQALDLGREGIDLAVRVGRSPESGLKQRRIGSFRDILCGTKTWQQDPQALSSHPYIAHQWQGDPIVHRYKDPAGRQRSLRTHARCRVNSVQACAALLRQGQGIGLLPDFIFRQSPELRALLPEDSLPENSVYVLHPYPKPPLAVLRCMQAIEQAWQALVGETHL